MKKIGAFGPTFFIEKFSKTYPLYPIPIVALFPEFLFYIKNFFEKSIFGKIYIFSIQNNFRFQKNFLNSMKNFLGAKFQLFGLYHLQTFLSKNRQKSPTNFFQSAFWLKCEKKIGPGLPR